MVRAFRVLVFALVLLLLAGCGDASTGTTTPASATSAPTHAPTVKVAGSPATHGTPRLGSPLSDFIGTYGQPDSGCATCQKGVFNFKRYQGTQLDYISTVLTDASGRVNAFIVQSPPNQDWDTTTATALCESFGPSDASYSHALKVMPSSDGSNTEKVYKSAVLASQLVTSDFQDLNTGANLTPGTFDIEYGYDGSPSKISQCSLESGIQAQ